MPVKETIWAIEPHTKAKHIILERYLKAWFPILSSVSSRILYIDGFAGPGKYKHEEIGSPIIALNVAKDHIHELKATIVFAFIEADHDRCNYLDNLLKDLDLPDNFKVFTICDKFDNQLSQLLNQLDEQKARLAPSFVFIDPFGYSQTPFSVVKRIMSKSKTEILITFVYDYINRFIGQEDRAHVFDELFGTDEWRTHSAITDPEERKQFIHDLYVSQLREEAQVKYVRSFEMVNKHGHTEYFLIFGTNHISGLKHMKYAMWQVDDTGEYFFSDRTDSDQTVLFIKEPDYLTLKSMLLDKFKGETVTIEAIEEFVLAETAFRESHFKKPILKPMEYANPPEIEVSCRTRKGTYPAGCNITFY